MQLSWRIPSAPLGTGHMHSLPVVRFAETCAILENLPLLPKQFNNLSGFKKALLQNPREVWQEPQPCLDLPVQRCQHQRDFKLDS